MLGYLNRSVQCFQSVAIDNTPPSPSCYRLKTMLPVEHFRTHKNPYATTYSLPELYYSHFFSSTNTTTHPFYIRRCFLNISIEFYFVPMVQTINLSKHIKWNLIKSWIIYYILLFSVVISTYWILTRIIPRKPWHIIKYLPL